MARSNRQTTTAVNGQLQEGLQNVLSMPIDVAVSEQHEREQEQAKLNAMMAELAKLRAENQKLKDEKPVAGQLTLKRSEKGALSVYGMGRFPVTLYREQWEKLFANTDRIKKFIADNSDVLKTKGQD